MDFANSASVEKDVNEAIEEYGTIDVLYSGVDLRNNCLMISAVKELKRI